MTIKKVVSIFKQTHWAFVAIAGIFGLIYVFITPPLWGFDEVAHFNRAYQISEGKLIPPVDKSGALNRDMPSSLVQLEYYVYGDLMDNSKIGISFRKDVDNRDMYARLTGRSFSKDLQTSPIVASYSPIANAAPSVGIAVANLFNVSIGATIILARLSSLVAYILIVYFALSILKNKKIKWLVFVVALMPMSVFQASMISADGMTIGLSLLFMSLLLSAILDPSKFSKKNLYIIFTVAALIPLVKANYIFLSLGLILIPNSIFSKKKIAIVIKSVGLVLMTIATIVWSVLTKYSNDSAVSPRPDGLPVVASDQIMHMLHHPIGFFIAMARSLVDTSDRYIQSMTSMIGWNEVALPFIFIGVIIVGIIIAVLYAKEEAILIRKKLYVLNVLAILGVVSIFAAMYIYFNPTGYSTVDGVQGRYFIPFIIPISALIVSLLPSNRLDLKDKTVAFMFIATTSAVLLSSVICYYLATY